MTDRGLVNSVTKVLAHRAPCNHRQPTGSISYARIARYLTLLSRSSAIILLYVILCCKAVAAQVLQGGQVFTDGLAIVDSPAPNTTLHAGSSVSVSIDVSGNGNLSKLKGGGTGFDTLTVFLVSAETSLNVTVSDTPALLTQEPGSSVKHLKWPIPTCIFPGQYNLTFYEAIHIQGQEYFAITPIPVKIENTAEPGACSSSNQLEAQPQDSSPPPENPWLHPDVLTNASAVQTSASSSATADSTQVPPAPLVSDVITITIGSVGIKFPLTIIPPGASETIVLQPPDLTIPGVITIGGPMTSGSPTDAAVTVMVTPTTSATVVTAVIASVATYTGTTTAPGGQSSVYTTMQTSYSTMTALAMQVPMNDPNYSGFLPINAISSTLSITVNLLLFYGLAVPTILLILR